jgi:hypothetical protein
MKKRLFLIGAGVLAAFSGVAYAVTTQILAPPLPTGVSHSGACYIRNTGTTALSVTASLFSNNGLIVNFNNCNGSPLGGGRTCVILVDHLPDDSFASCVATASNTAKLRGTLEVREVSPVLRVLVSEDLR